ncbi:hypothetical protein X732_21200 [Mesorhizobium sp. L2C066B000]|nr:hypothetical protein X732_21200 [Mesorhizobium sp. L2C066B000]
MMRTQALDHRPAHQAGNDGDLRQGQRQHRADLVDQCAITPAADRQQLPGQSEHQLNHRSDDEGGDSAAGGRQRNHRIVAKLVLVERGDGAEHRTKQQRQDQRGGAELDRYRQPLGKQFGDGEVRQIVARPEIAAQEIAEIVGILQPERIVEAELCFQIGPDLGTEAPLLIERAARCDAYQEERHCHDDEQRRNGGQKPP